MKTMYIFILLTVLTFNFTSQAQDQGEKKQLYQHKVESYTTMRNAGIGLTIGGTILTIAGITSMSNAIASDPDLLTDEMASKYTIGLLCASLGMTGTGGGIVFWVIGSSKKNYYSQRLNSLTFNLNPNPYHLASLTYRF
jgi:hypothetical protein